MIKIPKKKDYLEFLEKFSRGISKEFPNTCFYTYGSINNDCNYSWSDIDGGLILDSGIITPKKRLLKLAELFSEALGNKNIKTQFNLLDRITCRDGRFLSYTKDYTDWIKNSGKVLCRHNYLNEMNGRDYKSGVLDTAAFNFCGPRGVRCTLFHSLAYVKGDKDYFVERVSKALDKVTKFPKKLLWLRNEEIIPSRIKAKKMLGEILEDVDLTMIDKLDKLFKNPQKFYSGLENVDESLKLLCDSLDCMERMVQSYINHFPEISDKELIDKS